MEAKQILNGLKVLVQKEMSYGAFQNLDEILQDCAETDNCGKVYSKLDYKFPTSDEDLTVPLSICHKVSI